jgi:membrane associated rhomboid family serine protease
MRSAAVGHQCVECVNEGARSVRQATTAFGGREANRPLVTYVLIAINVVMFAVQTALPEFEKQFFLWPNGVAHYDQYYRLLTSGFLHTGITHIAFNMIALYFTGPALERAMGHTRFLALYLLSLLGGSVLVYLLTPLGTPTLGASGAIFGLFGASFVLAKKLQFDVRGIVGLIVINLVITFVVPGISWQGHVGGLVTGAAVAAAFGYAPRANRTLIQAGCSVVILVVFAGLIAWRTGVILAPFGY